MGGFFDQVASFLNHPLTLALGGFAVFCLAVLWGLNNVRVGKPKPFSPTDTPWLNVVFATAIGLSPILAVLFVAVLAMLIMVGWHIFASSMIANDPDNLRWYVLSFVALLTALGGIIGTPLAIIRIWNSERQTSTQEAALFNEKINAAALGLAARRQVTRVIGQGGDEKVLTEWQDDLVSRNAAIDQLEGLVHERPEAADRIASLLSIYVVELSAEHPPDEVSPDGLHEWAFNHCVTRSDMEKAAQTLGRLQQIKGVQLQDGRIDLRRANLQRFDLQGLDFSTARLEMARLEAADLEGANLVKANLRWANLKEADLGEAYLGGANLEEVHLEGANLFHVHLEGAGLWQAHLERANFTGAHLDEKTSLAGASIQSGVVSHVDWSNVWIMQEQLNSLFGDASVILPAGRVRPSHWPNTVLKSYLFHGELEYWRADPASYLPPQNRS